MDLARFASGAWGWSKDRPVEDESGRDGRVTSCAVVRGGAPPPSSGGACTYPPCASEENPFVAVSMSGCPMAVVENHIVPEGEREASIPRHGRAGNSVTARIPRHRGEEEYAFPGGKPCVAVFSPTEEPKPSVFRRPGACRSPNDPPPHKVRTRIPKVRLGASSERKSREPAGQRFMWCPRHRHGFFTAQARCRL